MKKRREQRSYSMEFRLEIVKQMLAGGEQPAPGAVGLRCAQACCTAG